MRIKNNNHLAVLVTPALVPILLADGTLEETFAALTAHSTIVATCRENLLFVFSLSLFYAYLGKPSKLISQHYLGKFPNLWEPPAPPNLGIFLN